MEHSTGLAAVIKKAFNPLGLGIIPPKGWPIQLDTVRTLQKIHDKYSPRVCINQTYYSIGAKHCAVGIVRSVVYERPVR